MTTKRGPIADALETALEAVEAKPEDLAAISLARRYAGDLDAELADLGKVGPLLLDVLRDLGMTPKARAAVVKGGGQSDGGQRSKLDELRARRENQASSVDPGTA